MDNDLISRSALRKVLCEEYEAREHYIGEKMLEAIDNAPTIDLSQIESVTINELSEEDKLKFMELLKHPKTQIYIRNEMSLDGEGWIVNDKNKSERPQGEWIIDEEGGDSTCTLVTCPFCKERMCCKMNFCGNCGADMRGGKK